MPVYVQTPNPEVLLTSGKNEVHSWLSKRDFGTIYTKQSKETKGWRAKQISINYCNSKGWFTRTTQAEAEKEAQAQKTIACELGRRVHAHVLFLVLLLLLRRTCEPALTQGLNRGAHFQLPFNIFDYLSVIS